MTTIPLNLNIDYELLFKYEVDSISTIENNGEWCVGSTPDYFFKEKLPTDIHMPAGPVEFMSPGLVRQTNSLMEVYNNIVWTEAGV